MGGQDWVRLYKDERGRSLPGMEKTSCRKSRSALPAALRGLGDLGVPSAPLVSALRPLGLELSLQFFPRPPLLQPGLLKCHLLWKAFPGHLI